VYADSVYVIGDRHSECQDYALAGDAARGPDPSPAVVPAPARLPIAIVCDGCSSSPSSDVGARALAWSAMHELRACPSSLDDHQGLVARALERAEGVLARLGLPNCALHATLGIASVADGRYRASLFGDGTIAVERRDGSIELSTVEYEASCPLYPAYGRATPQAERVRTLAGNAKRVTRTTIERSSGSVTATSIAVSTYDVETCTGEASDVAYVSVASDGLTSFNLGGTRDSAAGGRVDVARVAAEIFAYRVPTGAFVRRRAARFLRDARKRGWEHADDVSVASIWLGDA
jgi:hypothetical protein